MYESAFKILNTIDKTVHVYLPIIFDSIVIFISRLRENHRQLECYHHKYLLIAHNKRAFIVELFKLHSQERERRKEERKKKKKNKKKKDDDDDNDEDDDSTYHPSQDQGDEDDEWIPSKCELKRADKEGDY